MFRNWNRAVLAAATGLCLAGGPAAAKSSAVALVCDGEFRLQTARSDGTDETMFGGTMHVARVAEENAVVEGRLQSYEDGMKMPIQTFRLPLVEERADSLPLIGHRFRVPGALELLSDGISSNGERLKRLIRPVIKNH